MTWWSKLLWNSFSELSSGHMLKLYLPYFPNVGQTFSCSNVAYTQCSSTIRNTAAAAAVGGGNKERASAATTPTTTTSTLTLPHKAQLPLKLIPNYIKNFPLTRIFIIWPTKQKRGKNMKNCIKCSTLKYSLHIQLQVHVLTSSPS